MERSADKKIIGTTSLEEALEKFALASQDNRDVLTTSLKMKELMNQVIDERMFLNLTQRDLADITGIKQPMIARIERLESIPRLDTFLRIVDKLNLEVILDVKSDFSPIRIKLSTFEYSNRSSVNCYMPN